MHGGTAHIKEHHAIDYKADNVPELEESALPQPLAAEAIEI